jgi:hypothetical protein
LYSFGYLLLPEGKLLITEIKNSWNNFRLSTHYLNNKKNLSINSNFEVKFKTLFSLSSPYEIKNGIRFMRGTNILVYEGLKIIAIDNHKNNYIFSSISECSIAINIDRSKIKHCLLTGPLLAGSQPLPMPWCTFLPLRSLCPYAPYALAQPLPWRTLCPLARNGWQEEKYKNLKF